MTVVNITDTRETSKPVIPANCSFSFHATAGKESGLVQAGIHTISATPMDSGLHRSPRYSSVNGRSGHLGVLRYANWTAQPVQMSLVDTQKYYDSHRAISCLINDVANHIVIKSKPGNMIVVNNHRVLHGRKIFEPSTGNRHFQQVYMEIDDLLGRIRALRTDAAS